MSNLPQVQGVGSLQDALRTKVQTQLTPSGGENFLGYNTYSGKWTFGKDNEVLTPDDRVRVVPEALRHGWHRWADKKVHKVMSSVFQPLPEKPDPVTDAKGNIQQAQEARGLTGVLEFEDGDIQLTWEAATYGCRASVDSLLADIMLRAQEEAEYLYPVCRFTTGNPYENSYKAGEMLTPPVIDIVGWCNQEGEMAPDAPKQVAAPKAKPQAEEPAEEEEPAEAEEPTAEADPEPEKPMRQRRKRAA
jgi:hypothetical protein